MEIEAMRAAMEGGEEDRRDIREPRGPKPRAMIAGNEVKLEDGPVRSEVGGGWTASEVLVPENPAGVSAVAEGGMSAVEAVRIDRAERGAANPSHPEGTRLTALGQPFAIFHHPSEFTEAEDAVIVNGLMANLPLYMIAAKINCSRNLLSKHIKESKLLSEVYADAQEGFIDNVEWQAKRLIDSGNAAMIMFALERKGKDRGWGQQPVQEVDMDDTRIVIGEIPDSEVEEAEKKVKELEMEAGLEGSSGGEVEASHPKEKESVPASAHGQGGEGERKGLPSPMEIALMEETAKKAAADAVAKRDAEEAARTITIPQEDVAVERAPWDDGDGGGDMFGGGGDMDGFGGFM